jgi:RHS repeat-associated protein
VTGATVTKYYSTGSQRIAMRKNGTLYYLLGDHLGSTSIVTDASGTVISQTRYKAWGEVRHQSGVTPTEYQFTSQYSYAADFGLLFYNARMYDPALKRFISADTIVPPGVQGLDRYSYTNNNPVRYTDPSGHCSVWGDNWCYENPDVALSESAQQLIDFADSVEMSPEEVIGIGLGHEMFYDSEDEQVIHMQAFRNGFIQYADAECRGNRTYNCMLNYFSNYQSVKGQFDWYFDRPDEYRFDQVEGNLTENMQEYVTDGKSFMNDFMSTISRYSYDPAHNPADLELAVNTGVVYVSEFLSVNMGAPTAEMGFLIVKPATCPNGPGYTLVYNWYGQDFLSDYGISACQ